MKIQWREVNEKLGFTLLRMAVAVETSIAKAIDALVDRDNKLADEVINSNSSLQKQILFCKFLH
jgi:hypothetical protein